MERSHFGSFLCIVALSFLCACGTRNGNSAGESGGRRSFPSPQAPVMLTDPAEVLAWTTTHFWDRFTDTVQVYACDSAFVNGVSLDDLESQMGLFATLAGQVSPSDGAAAVSRLFDRIAVFAGKYPDSNVFSEMCRLTAHYLYDPNSPVRSEDLYLPFVERLGQSDLLDSMSRARHQWEAEMCRLNRTGTPATDFSFTDTRGRVRTLYGVDADYTVLIFANPGCRACQEITAAMGASPEISSLIRSGRVKVVDVYIDQEIEDWKAHIADYPPDWINGYDQDFAIRTDRLYHVRAIPSIYLLDKNKSVLMKDAPQEKMLEALATL